MHTCICLSKIGMHTCICLSKIGSCGTYLASTSSVSGAAYMVSNCRAGNTYTLTLNVFNGVPGRRSAEKYSSYSSCNHHSDSGCFFGNTGHVLHLRKPILLELFKEICVQFRMKSQLAFMAVTKSQFLCFY